MLHKFNMKNTKLYKSKPKSIFLSHWPPVDPDRGSLRASRPGQCHCNHPGIRKESKQQAQNKRQSPHSARATTAAAAAATPNPATSLLAAPAVLTAGEVDVVRAVELTEVVVAVVRVDCADPVLDAVTGPLQCQWSP